MWITIFYRRCKRGTRLTRPYCNPVIDRLADFQPVLALLGPGLQLETGGLPEETIADINYTGRRGN